MGGGPCTRRDLHVEVRGQRRSWFSPSTMWLLGIQLSSQAWWQAPVALSPLAGPRGLISKCVEQEAAYELPMLHRALLLLSPDAQQQWCG